MTDDANESAKRERSPTFPYVDLDKAVEYARTLYRVARKSPALLSSVAGDWGFSAQSSSTLRTAAALQSYGLADQSGSGDARRIQVTDEAVRLLEDDRPGIRDELLKRAALAPNVLSEYASKWREGRPSDNHAVSTLKFDSSFTDEGARKFLRIYDANLKYYRHQNPIEDEEPNCADAPVTDQKPSIIEEPSTLKSTPPTGQPQASDTPMNQPNETEVLRGSLGAEVQFRLLVKGNYTPEQLLKIVRLLQTQAEILSD